MTNRRGIFILFLVLLLSTTIASAKTINLDYLEDDYIVFECPDAQIVYNSGERPETDITILKVVNTSTLSLFWVKSNNISGDIDFTFVNDTKSYNYSILDCSEDRLYINIDYSTLPIPYSYITELEDRIEYLNNKIDALNQTITQLMSNNSNLSINLTEKISIVTSLQSSLASTVAERDQAVADKVVYQNENTRLEEDKNILADLLQNMSNDLDDKESIITGLNSYIDTLETQKEEKIKTINQLEDPFVIFYKKGDIDGVIHFPIFVFLLGAVIFSVIVYIIMRQANYSGKTLLDTISGAARLLPIGKSARRTPEDWNKMEEERYNQIDNQFLKQPVQPSDTKHEPETEPEPEPEPQQPSEQQENHQPPPEEPKKPKLQSSKEHSKNYWESPVGMARRKRMSEEMKGVGVQGKNK
jgi:prefoldin subunit 5